MNTSKDILNSIELSNLLNKIELQVKNIETGDAQTEIDNLMSFPFKSTMDNSGLRIETMNVFHGMLYKAFGLICQISLETNNKTLVSAVNKSCLQIINLLSSSYLEIQKVPMVKPLTNLYYKAPITLQRNSNDSLLPIWKNFQIHFYLAEIYVKSNIR